MIQIINILLIIFSAQSLCAQTKIYDFKNVADSMVSIKFEKSPLHNIKCKSISFIRQDNIRGWYPYGEPDINDTTNFKTATFLYSLYMPSVKSNLEFIVTVSKQKIFETYPVDFENIPNCVLTNTECHFINRDSALKIAIKNSILYPTNLSSVLCLSNKKKKYYWVIEGNGKEKIKRRTATRVIDIRQRKIIDPSSGEVVPYDQF